MCETWNRLDEDFERLIGRLEKSVVRPGRNPQLSTRAPVEILRPDRPLGSTAAHHPRLAPEQSASAIEPGREIRSSARLTAGGEAAVIGIETGADRENHQPSAGTRRLTAGAEGAETHPAVISNKRTGAVASQVYGLGGQVAANSNFKIARLPPPRVRRSDGTIIGNAPAEGSIRPISCRAV